MNREKFREIKDNLDKEIMKLQYAEVDVEILIELETAYDKLIIALRMMEEKERRDKNEKE